MVTSVRKWCLDSVSGSVNFPLVTDFMIGPSPGYGIFLAGVFFPKKNATQKICVCYQVCFFVAFSTGSSTERGQFFQLGGFFLSEVLRFITQNGSSKDVTFTERRVGG